ncbi:MAG: hypothetical protein P8103_16900 [Candidatus Thiodiazotropha sp.]
MFASSMNGGRQQLQSIHAMLSSGHASIRLERHTFILWGLAAGGLILLVPRLFSVELLGDTSQRLWAQNLLISMVLLATGIVDARWTARARRRRDESLSFVQRQITKLWWMLIALVVVINVGMNLYGGGYFFYGITLVLTGLGIYVYGLFSRQLLTWSGALQILLGLVMIAVSPELHVQEWVTASAFGIGFPAFAWMVDRTSPRHALKELALSLTWLALVLVPAAIAIQVFHGHRFSEWSQVAWQDYQGGSGGMQEGSVVLTLPVGTEVPIAVQIFGDLLQPVTQPAPLIMRTTKPLQLAFEDGEALGLVRIDDGDWRSGYDYKIRLKGVEGRLSPEQGPSIDMQFQVTFGR